MKSDRFGIFLTGFLRLVLGGNLEVALVLGVVCIGVKGFFFGLLFLLLLCESVENAACRQRNQGLGKPMVNALEKLHRPNNRTLCFADVERRTGLIRDHMKLTGEDLQGKQVVVVDEAIFTGTTLRIVCQMLREAGAAKVHIAIPTPMSNCRCAQYVLPAMPSLADSMPPSKMLDYFGADSLTYIPGQSFLEIARPSGAVCTDCFEA